MFDLLREGLVLVSTVGIQSSRLLWGSDVWSYVIQDNEGDLGVWSYVVPDNEGDFPR